MYYFKARYQTQKKAYINNFHEKLDKHLVEPSDFHKFKEFQQNITSETGKGFLIGLALGVLAFINFRKVEISKFSNNKRILSFLLPVISSPLYFYLNCMESFHQFETIMGLKYGRNG